MSKITVIMKVTNLCNMRCKHCYEDGNELDNSCPIMSDEVLQAAISKAQSVYDKVTYIWFGGEPLLAGLGFFERAVFFQEKHNRGNQIQNRIQTNGLSLDDDFISFFKKNNFNLSLSFDGLYNDFLRAETNRVLDKINLCKSRGLTVNVLTTVCSETSSKQIENYEYFKSLGLPAKFNPIFPAGAAKTNSRFLLDEAQYFEDTRRFFKHWINDCNPIPVSTFVQYTKMYLGYPHRNCVYSACLYTVINIEPCGDILPCSRYSKAEYLMGNILQIHRLPDAFEADSFKNIVMKSIVRRNKCKAQCDLYNYCLGGCSSASANECGPDDNNTQLCRITKSLLPFVFKALSLEYSTQPLKNPLLKFLKQ